MNLDSLVTKGESDSLEFKNSFDKEAIETACGAKAKENLLPMQAGDVPVTYANVDALFSDMGF